MKESRSINFHGVKIDLKKDGKDINVSFWKKNPTLPTGWAYFGEITKKEIVE